jgi:hypothetical protein
MQLRWQCDELMVGLLLSMRTTKVCEPQEGEGHLDEDLQMLRFELLRWHWVLWRFSLMSLYKPNIGSFLF